VSFGSLCGRLPRRSSLVVAGRGRLLAAKTSFTYLFCALSQRLLQQTRFTDASLVLSLSARLGWLQWLVVRVWWRCFCELGAQWKVTESQRRGSEILVGCL
jgi:hypothetical protein